MSAKYTCVVADPPWQFGDKLPGKSRGAEKNYSVMNTTEICSMYRGPVDAPYLALCGKKFRIADDALLFLWRVASMPREALQVIGEWGFEPKSEIVWIKAASEHDAKVTGGPRDGDRVKTHTLHFGMGRYVRGAHETCIIAARGKAASLIQSHSERSVFVAPVPRDKRGKIIHSAKPEAFYQIVERLVGGPRLELFARSPRVGWRCAGNEIGVV